LKPIRIWGVLALTFRDSIRTKWLVLFTIVFFLLAIDIPTLIAAQVQLLAADYIATFLSVLVPLAFPLIPILSLPMGATTIVDERESGTLQLMLSHPLSKSEFFVGRSVGLVIATTLAVILGFGGAGVVSYRTHFSEYSGVVTMVGYAAVLNAVMLGIGLIISNLSKRKVTALVTAIFIWLLFTGLSSVDQLALILNLKFGVAASVALILFDPIELSRILTIVTLGLPATDYGNLGLIALAAFGNSMVQVLNVALAVWVVVLFAIGFFIFSLQDVA
jgi:Cu-processing system permease protein